MLRVGYLLFSFPPFLPFSLLQLDANLIEAEPSNHLTQKIKTTESSAIFFKYSKFHETGSKNQKPAKAVISVGLCPVVDNT